MGADFIGASVFVPGNGVREIVTRCCRRIERVVSGSVVDFEKLNKLVDISEYQNIAGEDPADMLMRITEDLRLVRDLRTPGDIAGRYGTYCSMTVNGKDAYVVYTGEMSWGDTPENPTYECIDALWRLGIARALNSAINWGRAPGRRK